MKYLTFSNQDKMPILGLGTWKSEKGEVYDAVREAIRIGYRHIDCAAIYGNEKEIGQALEDAMKDGDVKREELWITSKLWNTSHRKEQVEPALRKTLSDLRLDYLDLYLIHWPVVIKEDAPFPFTGDAFISLEEVPIRETWGAMEAIHAKGLARHIGVSNFSTKKLSDVLSYCKQPPEMNQIEMHPYLQQPDMLEFCKKHNIHLTAYSPLGSRDRIEDFENSGLPDLFKDTTIKSIAKAHDATPAQVLIRWAIDRDTAVIPKSVNPKRLRQNFEAASLQLSEDEMKKIRELDRHYRYVDGTFWTPEGSPYSLEGLWDER